MEGSGSLRRSRPPAQFQTGILFNFICTTILFNFICAAPASSSTAPAPCASATAQFTRASSPMTCEPSVCPLSFCHIRAASTAEADLAMGQTANRQGSYAHFSNFCNQRKNTSHATRHTSRVTRHTSHVTRHTSRHTTPSSAARYPSHITHHHTLQKRLHVERRRRLRRPVQGPHAARHRRVTAHSNPIQRPHPCSIPSSSSPSLTPLCSVTDRSQISATVILIYCVIL